MSDALKQLIQQAEIQKLQMQMNVLYSKNLSLFLKRFPSVHKIVANYKAEKNVLRLDPKGNINLLNIQSGQFLYPIDPREYCKQQVTKFKHDTQPRLCRIAKNDAYNPAHIHLPRLNAMLDEFQIEEPEKIEHTPNFITNLMLASVGLGHHISELINEFNICHLFVYENDIDTFFASLHTTDWEPILNYFEQGQREISFCIGLPPRNALAHVEFYINKRGLHTHVFNLVYKHSLREEEANFIHAYYRDIQAFICTIGFFDDEQIGLAHAYKNINSDVAAFLGETPRPRKSRLLIIGNGPSLDEHNAYIEENQQNAVIMSCGSALGSLLKMGIKPDFHIEMERTFQIADFIHQTTTEDQREGITLLCLHTVAPETIKAFDECCIALKDSDAGNPLIKQYYAPSRIAELKFCNPTVTNSGLAFAIAMGFRDVHLIGVDLGMKDESQHHSKFSYHYEMEKHVEDKENFRFNYDGKNDNIICEGNFGGQVISHPVLNASRVTLERLLKHVTNALPDFRCINSNDGAKIAHTLSQKISGVSASKNYDKQQEIEDIRNQHFYQHKNTSFENKTKEDILAYFYSIQEKIKLSDTSKTEEEFYQDICRAFSELSLEKDPITHYLLRGSANYFFGAMIEYGMYCKHDNDFQRIVRTGVQHFNSFIDEIFEKMKRAPFAEDDTIEPIIHSMREKQAENSIDKNTR